MVHSKTNLCGLSNNFYENDKFEDRDPSKKFLIQKHVMQSQLVEEPGAWQPRKPIKIFENEKFQESDPSKKFPTQNTYCSPSWWRKGRLAASKTHLGIGAASKQLQAQLPHKHLARDKTRRQEEGKNMKKTERQKRQKDKKSYTYSHHQILPYNCLPSQIHPNFRRKGVLCIEKKPFRMQVNKT